MSIARHHNEWLTLVPNSGPFLSLPVLMRAFPQGLPAADPELRKETRLMFEGWEDGKKDRAVRRAWFDFVLRSVLQFLPEVIAEGQTIPPGMEARMSEFGEVLRPDVAIIPPKAEGQKLNAKVNPNPDPVEAANPTSAFSLHPSSFPSKPRLLVQFVDSDQDPEKPLRDKHWKASPATRMTELLHAADVPLGLITNGEHWMLVHVPRGETSGFASWYAPLWFEEPLTFQAFQAVLSVQRFFGVPDDQTIEALLTQSAQNQQEVTEQLGWQVRKAVEVLIQSLDKIDQDYRRRLLDGVGEKQLYEAALTVMMRLVFLFSAEERDLVAVSDRAFYDQFYAVSPLRDQLQEIADKHVEEILDARFDAWSRLLATFRAVYGGVQHEAMRLPPYGGTLFNPDRFPFLEGRKPGTNWRNAPAEPLKVSNRTVLHLLNALQILQVKVPGGGAAEARRLSFRSLDIEQIGHVYEGLLDHTAMRATEPVLGLKGSKNKEPEIALSKMGELGGGKAGGRAAASVETAEPFLLAAETPGNVISLPTAKGNATYGPPEKLVEFIKDETGRSVGAIKRELTGQSGVDESRLLLACGHDRELLDRVWPFAALLRDDTFGFPVVIPTGSIYVTQGSDRRSTGTHYTPRSLTEPIVQYTLEPLVYVGPAEGTPREHWKLKSAREILELKVCDMAMGSGAFLVQTCRYMAERLVEAWENEEEKYKGSRLKAEGNQNAGEAADSTSAFSLQPLALLAATPSTGDPAERLLPTDPAERITLARRAIADRCLYGVDINPMAVEMAKLSLWLITLQRDRPFTFLDHALRCGDSLLGVSSVKQIENFSLRAKAGETVQHTFATANLFRYVDEATEKHRALQNLPSNDHTQIETKNRLHAEAEAATAKVKALADCLIAFELRGLDGEKHEDQRTVAADHAELAMRKPLPEFQAYASEQLRGRRTLHWPLGFPEVCGRGGFDAFVGNPPFMHGSWISSRLGDDFQEHLRRTAPGVSGKVDFVIFFLRRAAKLVKKEGTLGLILTAKAKEGDARTSGFGVLLESGCTIYHAWPERVWPGEASVLICFTAIRHGQWEGACRIENREVASIDSRLEAREEEEPICDLVSAKSRVFLGAKPDSLGFVLEPFQAKSLSRNPANRPAIRGYFSGVDLNELVELEPPRFIIDFSEFSLEAAATTPELLAIVEAKVKPDRMNLKREAYRKRWWQFTEPQLTLFHAIRKRRRALAVGRVSKYFGFRFVNPEFVFSDKVVVFDRDSWEDFAVLSSDIHNQWALRYGTTHGGGTPNYKPSECGGTFPFPVKFTGLESLGVRYHEFRRQIMLSRQEGLTKTYNHFHNPAEQSEDIAHLRVLHVEMDQAVAAAYGWSDLDLGHGFHETKQGVRYTISASARRTVLDRLLALNHQRYAEEVKAGLHEKKRGAGSGERRAGSGKVVDRKTKTGMNSQAELFG